MQITRNSSQSNDGIALLSQEAIAAEREWFVAWLADELSKTGLKRSDAERIAQATPDEVNPVIWAAWLGRAARAVPATGEQESMTLQEVWEAAGGNPGIKPNRTDVMTALRDLDAVCDTMAAKGGELSPVPGAAQIGWYSMQHGRSLFLSMSEAPDEPDDPGYKWEPAYSGLSLSLPSVDMPSATTIAVATDGVAHSTAIREHLQAGMAALKEYAPNSPWVASTRAILARNTTQAAPTVEQAHAMGVRGAPHSEPERMLYEAYCKGHCWQVGPWIDGEDGQSGHYAKVDDRIRFAMWLERAALGFGAYPVAAASAQEAGAESNEETGHCGDLGGDAIARTKRILALVDDYASVLTTASRTRLRVALMEGFEALLSGPCSPRPVRTGSQAADTDAAAELSDQLRKVLGKFADEPEHIQSAGGVLTVTRLMLEPLA